MTELESFADVFRVETDDGIAVLTWDMRGREVNVFTERSLEALAVAVEALLAEREVKGVVITSAKKTFHAGADLSMISKMASLPPRELLARMLGLHAALRRIETGGKPFAAAIAGHALGGGLELALACHARFVARDAPVQLGLPEVKVGLMPGLGGTQRLTRLVRLEEALPAMAEGRQFPPGRALELGLVTGLAPRAELVGAAKAWLLSNLEARQPWDRPGFRPPSGPVQSAKGLQFFAAASANLRKHTGGHYPAPGRILEATYHGLQLPFDVALRLEARLFASLVRTPEAKAMIGTLFGALNDANALKRRPDASVKSFESIGVVGAGLMGGGIAHAAAKAGLRVVLLDQSKDAAKRGRAYSEVLLQKAVKAGRVDQARMAEHLDRIQPTDDFASLQGLDLVVEAVFESKEVKRRVLQQIEANVGPDALIASNTSTIPITELAAFLRRQGRFLGLHFFSPVEKMQLVEIISGERTESSTLAAAFDFCSALRKTPVAVRDGRGFFTTRVVSSYMVEGMALVSEGVSPALVENAGRAIGMPMGPLRLADLVNLDLAVNIADQTKADLGASYVHNPGIDVARRLVELGRPGQKAGRGFYDHEEGDARLWPGLRKEFGGGGPEPSASDVGQRLMAIQLVETLRCFDEGIVETREDADVASILGWGFPPFTGGVASMASVHGRSEILTSCQELERRHGQRFRPPESTPAWLV